MDKIAFVVFIFLLSLYFGLLITPIGQQILGFLGSFIASTTDKTNVELLRSVVETLAIFVAGYWTILALSEGAKKRAKTIRI